MPLAAARIVEYATEHDIPPWAQVITGSSEEQALLGLGWQPTYVPTEVLVARLGDFLGQTLADPEVRVSEQFDESWERGYAESRPNDADRQTLRMILAGQPPHAFASAQTDAGVFAIARGHVNGNWLGWPRSGRAPTNAGAAGRAGS